MENNDELRTSAEATKITRMRKSTWPTLVAMAIGAVVLTVFAARMADVTDIRSASAANTDSVAHKAAGAGCSNLILDRVSGNVTHAPCDLASPQLPDDYAAGREDMAAFPAN